jgi:hypothetical protein
MKNLFTIVAVIFFLLPVGVKAEGGGSSSNPKIKLTWGQEYQLPKGLADIGFVGNAREGYIQFGHRYGKSLSMQRFTPSLKLTSEKIVDLKKMPKGYMIDEFVQWDGNTYMFYSTWDKPAQKEHLFVQKIDVTKGDFASGANEIIATDKVLGNIVVTGFYQFQAAHKYKMIFSSDSSKLFVYVKYAREKGEAKGSNDEYGLWVFDKNFKVLWTKRVKMPYDEKKMSIEDVDCDRAGDYLFLSKAYNDDSRKDIKDNAPNFHFEVLKFAPGSDKPVVIPFDFKDKYVAQLTLLEDLDGNVVCCGFYGEKDAKGKLRAERGRVDGSFFLKIDPSTNKIEKIHKGFYEIPQEYFKEYVGEKAEKKIEKKEEKGEEFAASNMRLRHVIFNSDGSMMLLGEEYYMTVTTYMNGNHMETRYTYYYLDILAQRIDASGEESWTRKIPKRQIGSSTFGAGFKVMPYNGDNYLFFLDNMKNLNITKDQAPVTHSMGWGGVLMGVKLDANGDTKKSVMFDTREVKEKIDITSADEVAPGTLIARTWNKKVSKICLISLQ